MINKKYYEKTLEMKTLPSSYKSYVTARYSQKKAANLQVTNSRVKMEL